VNWALPLLLAVIPLTTAWLLRHVQQFDDQYITYTYAHSLAAGQGFSYNGGWVLLGTTTPGWTLVLALLAWLFPWVSIPTLGHLVGGLCAAATVWLLSLCGRQTGYVFAGLAMAALVAFDPLFPWVMGFEYPMLLMFCVLSLVLVLQRRYELGAVAAGLALITRYDAAIFVVLLALWVTWQERRILWRPLLILVVVFGTWLAYAYFTFGSILPAALDVKQAHGALNSWPRLDVGFWRWFTLRSSEHFSQLVLACLGLLAVGLVGMALHRAAWLLPIMAWGVLYVLFYLEIGVAFYVWYFVPVWFVLMVSATGSAGVLSAWHVTTNNLPPWRQTEVWLMRAVVSAAVLAVVGLAADEYGRGMLGRKLQVPAFELYTQTGQWLKQNTPPDTKVGFIEVGYIGFYSQRPIVDALGLVTPGIVPFLLKQDFQGILAQFQPEYYLRNTAQDDWLITQVLRTMWFQEHYSLVHQITVNDYPGTMMIYRWRNEESLSGAANASAIPSGTLSPSATDKDENPDQKRARYARLLSEEHDATVRFQILMEWAIMERFQPNLPAATDLLEQALRLRPQDVEAHANYGAVLLDAGRPADAAREFEIVVRLNPQHFWGYYFGGLAYQRTGRLPEALTALQRSVDLAPDVASQRNAVLDVLAVAAQSQDCVVARSFAQRFPAFAVDLPETPRVFLAACP
jgi:tetratricopeptide (TPR) repeat protein